MTVTEQKFRDLLKELFRFDRADLDFGIYRIMNLKRDEIQQFIDTGLLPQIRQVLERSQGEQTGDLQQQLEKAREAARAAGLENTDEAPKVKELLGKYHAELSIDEQEQRVFGHLLEFFGRYYKDGDFIPLPRYKKGVYALPYEGEEVKLSWANQDQYYIKSSEELRDYSFRLPDKRIVRFRVVQAEENRDNNKAQQDKDRRFILATNQPVAEENGELVIRFEYRPDDGKRKQDDINDATVAAVAASAAATAWRASLQMMRQSTDVGILSYHLRQFTARNTYDYFIHKNLGGFLRRELDFYLKNEVLDLDNVEESGAEKLLREQFGIVRSVRVVGDKIIDFLAQLEDFQKKLWLKKKFVVSTDWCVTLDRVPRELCAEVAANTAQMDEWKRLFAVEDITGDTTTPGFTEPPSMSFLEHNPYLIVDTRFFGQTFKDRLLASFSDLDQQTDGLLIHSENFQALELLQERYRQSIKCIYVDPPYNTGHDDFSYKDNYRHSSWLQMMRDRTSAARHFMQQQGLYFCSIDETEMSRLRIVADEVFGVERYAADLIWNTQHSQQAGLFKPYHEYVQVYTEAPSEDLENFGGGSGQIVAGAMKKESLANPASEFRFPAGIRWEVPDGTELSGCWGDVEKVQLVAGRMVAAGGKTKYPVTLRAGWTQKRQMERSFAGEPDVLDSKGQRVLEFFFSSTGKLKCVKQREKVTPSTMLPLFGTGSQATGELQDITGVQAFAHPKPVGLIAYLADLGLSDGEGSVLDYFAGSGTTAHALINLNREDGGHRKYILVEMGDYFDTVLKPRIEKVIYSEDWKDGKPVSRKGSSHLFKYMTLESYDDTLANLVVKSPAGDNLFAGATKAQEQYLLKYMLEVETRGSQSLLSASAFDDPFSYSLKVAQGPETVETPVDLVETFNYLIGLHVRNVDTVRGIRVVQGTSPQGERVLVLWRNAYNTNADQLNDWFTRQGYNTRDTEYDVIYVNGDNHLENLRRADQTWKVRLIEPEFQRLMFDVQDV